MSLRLLAGLLVLTPPAVSAAPAKPAPHLWRVSAERLPAGATDEAVARAVLAREAAALGLDEPGAGLHLVRVLADGAHRVVRLERIADGLPVAGREAAVRLGPDGALVHAHLDPPGRPAVGSRRLPTAEAAEAAVRKLLGDPPLRGPVRVQEVLWPATPPFVAWLVDLPLAPPPLLLRAVVDAGSGAVASWQRLDHAAALADVYETNPETSDLVEVRLPWLPPDADVLEGRYAEVARCRMRRGRCQARQEADADEYGNFFYGPDDRGSNDRDPFAEVSAYWHVNRIHDLFGDLGLDPDELEAMRVWVNLPDFGNAAFSPYEPALLFGQGDRDFAYDGDVIYHEYTHAVVSVTARLQAILGPRGGAFDWLPGVLNEGLADSFSSALSGDSELGEYAGAYGWGGEIRDMDGNTRCPDHLMGEEHHDSQPFSQAMWEVREALGDEVYLPLAWSLLVSLVPDSGPADAAALLSALAAEDLDEEGRQAVEAALERHALDRCLAVVPLVPGQTHAALGRSSYELTMGQLHFEMPSPLQFSVEVPPRTRRLTVSKRIRMCPRDCPQATWFSLGEPVGFFLGRTGELETESDHVVRDESEAVLEDPEPGTWYLATTSLADWTFYYTVSVDLDVEPEPTEPDVAPDVGPAGDAGPDVSAEADAGQSIDTAEGDEEAGADPIGAAGPLAGVPIRQMEGSCGCRLGRSQAPWRRLAGLVGRR